MGTKEHKEEQEQQDVKLVVNGVTMILATLHHAIAGGTVKDVIATSDKLADHLLERAGMASDEEEEDDY